MNPVRIYTDGACLHNPGPGGWAALLITDNDELELTGGARYTTNNRMEMIAAIKGLEACQNSSKVLLFTDSKYLRDGITVYIRTWRKNGWRTAKNSPVKNIELWQRLDELVHVQEVQWHWVKGHSGNPENERVDSLAREQARKFQEFMEQGNEL